MTNLKQAKEALRISEEYTRAILNSVVAQITVPVKDGTIQDVNLAWEIFSEENGGTSSTRKGKGLHYLQICRDCSGGGTSKKAGAIADGIEVVLRGEKPRVIY